MNKLLITHNFEETRQLGFDFAKKLKGGEVVALHGDLGSGKTTFVQGLALGLGITKKIISPTFIIMRTYVIPAEAGIQKIDSRLHGNDRQNFYHVDLYRIEGEKDVEGLGLLELMGDAQNIVVIEWPEKIENLLPEKRTDIFFEYVADDTRRITFA